MDFSIKTIDTTVTQIQILVNSTSNFALNSLGISYLASDIPSLGIFIPPTQIPQILRLPAQVAPSRI